MMLLCWDWRAAPEWIAISSHSLKCSQHGQAIIARQLYFNARSSARLLTISIPMYVPIYLGMPRYFSGGIILHAKADQFEKLAERLNAFQIPELGRSQAPRQKKAIKGGCI
jgi:hypothetical protein